MGEFGFDLAVGGGGRSVEVRAGDPDVSQILAQHRDGLTGRGLGDRVAGLADAAAQGDLSGGAGAHPGPVNLENTQLITRAAAFCR
jgi:hypothetical protein